MYVLGIYKMKIDIITLMRNEEFLLPYYLRHYETFANKIYIIDDHSTDRTAEIAKAHPKVVYSVYKHEGVFEDENNEAFENCYKTNCRDSDWVMIPGADEFVYHPQLLEILEQYLDFISVHDGVLKTVGYTMISDHLPTTKGQIYDEIKTGVRTKTWDKPLILWPKLDVKLGNGRHSADPPGIQTSIKLLHYRYLSRDWTINRNAEFYPRFDLSDKDREYRTKKAIAFYDTMSKDLKKVI
jgi:glycosyltransferase involved in cell wall biosynthesis